ncbi:MAG: HDIG domain-containing protein [Defluviitaleaceae bacterium]|nr:HDIG domain-containing protein [Defluviitaleaceae bacterium]
MKNKKEVYTNLFLLFFAYIITVALISFGSYIQYGYQINIGDVSPRDFRATHQIENRIATERERGIAKNSIHPIISRDYEVSEQAKIRLEQFFLEIEYYRELNTEEPDVLLEETHIPSEYSENSEHIEDIEETSEIEEQEPQPLIIPQISFLTTSQVEFLITLEDFEAFQEQVSTALESLFEDEITVIPRLTISAIQFYFPIQSFQSLQIALPILQYFLEPNMVIDEEITEHLREEIANLIDPIVFLQGQLIINSGEIVTEEIYTVLVDLNYISEGYTINFIPLIGASLVLLIVFGMGAVYIYLFSPFLNKNRKHKVLLFTLYMILIVPTMFLTIFLDEVPFIFVPVLVFTMLVGMLLRYKLAIILNVAATLITLLIVNAGLSFVIYFLITGTITAVTTRFALERSKVIIFSGLLSAISAVVVFSVLLLIERTITTDTLLTTSLAALAGFFIVIICMGTLPLWESFFGITTPIKLLEYTNPSNELLRRLSIEASGTYHHTIVVANLAEAAAYEIGADTILARVGAYFHDIGKLKAPKYFTENQIGYNYHDNIKDPAKSAYIIREHVLYGLELAEKHKLPPVIRDIIAEHHGTSLIKYFYFKAKNTNETLNEEDFRYPGPNPKSRESAIIMLADTVEAAVRSCITNNTKTKDDIPSFIEQLINDKITEGQLSESELTLKDIEKVKKVFLHVLNGMYHERVVYPTQGENNENNDTK